VGNALVAACEDHARSTGSNRLVICVRDVNAAAMTLYARHGFQRLPDRDWHPVPDVALLAFEKNLT
jgi:ribosomal protein S18 acetylase RimI-like enzyme